MRPALRVRLADLHRYHLFEQRGDLRDEQAASYGDSIFVFGPIVYFGGNFFGCVETVLNRKCS